MSLRQLIRDAELRSDVETLLCFFEEIPGAFNWMSNRSIAEKLKWNKGKGKDKGVRRVQAAVRIALLLGLILSFNGQDGIEPDNALRSWREGEGSGFGTTIPDAYREAPHRVIVKLFALDRSTLDPARIASKIVPKGVSCQDTGGVSCQDTGGVSCQDTQSLILEPEQDNSVRIGDSPEPSADPPPTPEADGRTDDSAGALGEKTQEAPPPTPARPGSIEDRLAKLHATAPPGSPPVRQPVNPPCQGLPPAGRKAGPAKVTPAEAEEIRAIADAVLKLGSAVKLKRSVFELVKRIMTVFREPNPEKTVKHLGPAIQRAAEGGFGKTGLADVANAILLAGLNGYDEPYKVLSGSLAAIKVKLGQDGTGDWSKCRPT